MVFSRDPEAEEIEAEYAALDKREVQFCFVLFLNLKIIWIFFLFLSSNFIIW